MKKDKQEEIKTYQRREWNSWRETMEIRTYYELRAQDKLKAFIKNSISKKLLEAFDKIIEKMAEDILERYDIRWMVKYTTTDPKEAYLIGSYGCREKEENGDDENQSNSVKNDNR